MLLKSVNTLSKYTYDAEGKLMTLVGDLFKEPCILKPSSTLTRNFWEGFDFLLQAITLNDLPLSTQVMKINIKLC